MVGDKIRTLLVDEMKSSTDFSRRNFGLAVGDDFREIVEETLKSKEVTGRLVCGLLIAALSGKSFGDSMAGDRAGVKDDEFVQRHILANFEAFKPYMEFLYWGIQIGRKLALQEVETLNKLEKQD
jgi:hypothetical protein